MKTEKEIRKRISEMTKENKEYSEKLIQTSNYSMREYYRIKIRMNNELVSQLAWVLNTQITLIYEPLYPV